ncbi:MAG: carboxypeptidase-like regulatory domain-containing protein [Bacteroidota bacterium]
MKCKILLSLLLTLITYGCFAQKITVAGVVYNSKDQKPIAYTNIYVKGENRYFDTDENGRFTVEASPEDTLSFSCIGYTLRSMTVSDFAKIKGAVLLDEITYTLQEVVVSNAQPKKFGISAAKQTRSFAGAQMSDSYEVATQIEIPAGIKQFRITKVFFRQKNFSAENRLRLHIYSADANGIPGEELLKKQVIIDEKDFKDGNLEIDVSDQDIVLTNNVFFVGVQWITMHNFEYAKGRKNDIGLGETSTIDSRLTYRRGQGVNHAWYVEYESGIYIPGNAKGNKAVVPIQLKGKPINILASVEILAL